MKIGILTFHRAHNCGAMLQAWALWQVLTVMGHDVSFPDINHVGEESVWPNLWRARISGKLRNLLGWIVALGRTNFVVFRARRAFSCFRKSRLRVVSCKTDALVELYDILVVGSDQVWSKRCAGEYLPLFLGENVAAALPMVGYAVSVGDDLPKGVELTRLYYACRKRFRFVSCREKSLSDALGRPVSTTCDPTLLLGCEQYKVLENPKRLVYEKYVFLYGISDVDDVWPVALKFAHDHNLMLVTAGFCSPALRRHSGVRMFTASAPDTFLALVRDADYVFVSSFHGCVFSILYSKKFVNIYGKDTMNRKGRQQNLLGALGLSYRRLHFSAFQEEICRAIDREYDVSDGLGRLRTTSWEFLERAIV